MRGLVKAALLVAAAAVAAPAGAEAGDPSGMHQYASVGGWHVFYGDDSNKCLMFHFDPLKPLPLTRPMIALDATIDEAEVVYFLDEDQAKALAPGVKQHLFLLSLDSAGNVTNINADWSWPSARREEAEEGRIKLIVDHDDTFLDALESSDAVALADGNHAINIFPLVNIKLAMPQLRKCAAEQRAKVDMD